MGQVSSNGLKSCEAGNIVIYSEPDHLCSEESKESTSPENLERTRISFRNAKQQGLWL